MSSTPTHPSCASLTDRSSYPIALTDYYRSCERKLFQYRYTPSNTQGFDNNALWNVASKVHLRNDSYSQTSPKDDNRLLDFLDNLLKINKELVQRITKIEEMNISLSESNDDLIKRMVKVEEANASLIVGHKDLDNRFNQLILQQALSDMFTYLINVLSLLSYTVRASGLSAGTLSECLANSVPHVTRDNDIDVCSVARTIVDKLSAPILPEVKNVNDNDHSTDQWRHIIELLHRLLRLEMFQGTENTLNDHDLVSLMIYLQTIKQERNMASHILPHWRCLHLCLDRVERDFSRVGMSLSSIDDDHRIHRFKSVLLKIAEIINGIFKQVNGLEAQKSRSYNELMEDIFQIIEVASSNSFASSSADNSIAFV